MLGFFTSLYNLLIIFGCFLKPALLLAMRLFWGWQFFHAGLGKVEDIAPIVNYFQTLNIPYPQLTAHAVAWIETIGGICLMLGFATRLVALPLIGVMIGALMTAHHDALVMIFRDPQNFVQQNPFNFLLTALIVLAFGPGAFSIDALIKRRIRAVDQNQYD